MQIGVISDTHGLVRPEVFDAFRGVELILHAGDIGSAEVLQALRAIAPVVAVRGNNDTADWAKSLPESVKTTALGQRIHILHDLKEISVDPRSSPDFDIVISGHSHKPMIERRDGVLYINPGSAGPRRFKLPVTVARLAIQGNKAMAKLIELIRTAA